jgi:hypothetical protein
MIRNPLSGKTVCAHGAVGVKLLEMHKNKEIKLPQKDVAILKGGGVSFSKTQKTSLATSLNTSNIPNIPLSMIYDGMLVPLSENTSRGNIHARVKLILSNKEMKERFFKEIDRLNYDGRIDVLVGIIGDLKVREYVVAQENFKEIVDYVITSLRNEVDNVLTDEYEELEDKLLRKIGEFNIDRKGNVVLDDKSRSMYHTIILFKLIFVCSHIEIHFHNDHRPYFLPQTNFNLIDLKTLRNRIVSLISATGGDPNKHLKITSGLSLPCEFDKDSYIKDVISWIRGLPIYVMASCTGLKG